MSSDEDISIKLNGIKNVKVIYPLNLETQYNFKNEFLTLIFTTYDHNAHISKFACCNIF